MTAKKKAGPINTGAKSGIQTYASLKKNESPQGKAAPKRKAKAKAKKPKAPAQKKRAKKAGNKSISDIPPNPVGRPTKYKPEYVQELMDYFNKPSGSWTQFEKKNGEVANVWVPAKFPTMEGFACEIDVHVDTLHEWATAIDENDNLIHPEFSEAYKKARGHQTRILVENGLAGGYQANFGIFTAKNVLKWRDTHTIAGDDDAPLLREVQVKFVEAPGAPE